MVVFQAHGGELRKGHAAVFERGQQRRVLVFTQDIAAGIYDEAGREPGRDQRGDVAQLLPLIFFDILSSSARRILEHMPAEAEYHLFCGEHVHIVHAAVEYGRAELKGRAHAELLLNVGLVADAGERRGIVGASAVARDDNARKIEPVFLRILRNEVERRGYLAVLRVEAQGLQPAEFGDASELKVGEEVFAIGNPGGDRYGGTLTGGYVSGLNRELEKSAANGLTYIQTDAAINPGNSGGALFNAYGQVVGINSNKVVSTSYEGSGFAIPISEVSNIIGDLMTKGYVSGRGRLGITARTVTELQAEASGIPTGVLIVSVDDDSPLKGIAFAGDIITEAAGEKISSLEDLYAVLRTHGGGESITVTIYSAGTADTKSSEEQYTIVLLEDRGETQAG